MPDINASLKEALNGKAPQHKKKGQSVFEFSEGSDGALHTKVTDENGIPIDPRKVEVTNQQDFPSDFPDSAVKEELEQIKQQQADILARLDQPVETQLTGSNVEIQTIVEYESRVEIEPGQTVDLTTIDVNGDFDEFSYGFGGLGTSDIEIEFRFITQESWTSGRNLNNTVINETNPHKWFIVPARFLNIRATNTHSENTREVRNFNLIKKVVK